MCLGPETKDRERRAWDTKGITLEKKGHTSVLLFVPKRVIKDLVDLCEAHRDELTGAMATAAGSKKAVAPVLPMAMVTEAISARTSMINLFGRMLAELPSSNVDGAVQVAHAFTTHVAEPEVDFFTAVDDLNLAGDTGSAHLNSAEFSAGVFYRYASVNVADLAKNLGGDVPSAIDLTGAFLDNFIMSLPGAKKNSTAPFTVPDLVYVTVRTDRPISLAAAFEQPMRMAPDGGYGLKSRQQLAHYAGSVDRLIGRQGIRYQAHAAIDTKPLESLGSNVDGFQDLISGASAALAAQ